MAGAAEQEKTPTLAEHWSLQEEENAKNEILVGTLEDVNPKDVAEDVKPKETTEDANATDTTEDANPSAVSSEESVTDKNDETPAAEAAETAVQEVAEEEEASEEKPVIKLETAPADFRFPTTNQTRHCFTRYIEYHRCINVKGEGAPECDKFAKYYRSLCPSEWKKKKEENIQIYVIWHYVNIHRPPVLPLHYSLQITISMQRSRLGFSFLFLWFLLAAPKVETPRYHKIIWKSPSTSALGC